MSNNMKSCETDTVQELNIHEWNPAEFAVSITKEEPPIIINNNLNEDKFLKPVFTDDWMKRFPHNIDGRKSKVLYCSSSSKTISRMSKILKELKRGDLHENFIFIRKYKNKKKVTKLKHSDKKSSPAGGEMANENRTLSRSDWEEAWHREKYTRCRETLVQHLYWACEKDIYRLTRRSEQPNEIKSYDSDYDDEYNYPEISPKIAKEMVRSRRGGSSITSECCSSNGCTWEEYAEYCPTNKRHTVFVN